MAYKNKEDQAASARKHYEKNKTAMKQKASDFAKIRKVRLLEIAWKIKDVPCTDCGMKYPPYVMDFDHVKGVKRFNVSSMMASGRSEKSLREEIAKCEVVCSNCHRERTYRRRLLNKIEFVDTDYCGIA